MKVSEMADEMVINSWCTVIGDEFTAVVVVIHDQLVVHGAEW